MPTTVNNTPFFRGKDVTLKFFQDSKPIYLAAKNFTWNQVAVEAADGVNGEDRDRLDLVTNYFEGSVDIYRADESVMLALIGQTSNDDAGGTPFQQSGSVRINHRDSTRACYKMKGMKLGPWTENASGRTETVMMTVKFRFRYWEPTQSI